MVRGPDRLSRKGWFDRRTFWPAVAIVAIVAAVVAIPVWLNHAVAETTRAVAPGETVTLEVDADNQVTVQPISGWERVDSLPSQLVLRDGEATVTIRVDAPVDNLDRYYDRLVRSLRTTGVQALPGEAATTDHGFAGLTGTLVSDGKVGELSVLADDQVVLRVQSLVPPDQTESLKPQITTMVNSMQERQ